MAIALTDFEETILAQITGNRYVDIVDNTRDNRGVDESKNKAAGAYINGVTYTNKKTAIYLRETWPCLVLDPNCSDANVTSDGYSEGIRVDNLPEGEFIYVRGNPNGLSTLEQSSTEGENTDAIVCNRTEAANGDRLNAGTFMVRDMTLIGGRDANFDTKIPTLIDNVTMLCPEQRGFKCWGEGGAYYALANTVIDMRPGGKFAVRITYDSAFVSLYNHTTIAPDGTVHRGKPPSELCEFPSLWGRTPATMDNFILLDEYPFEDNPFFTGQVDDGPVDPPVDPPDGDLEERVAKIEAHLRSFE